MGSRHLSPPVARSLYRSLLRACHNGQNPEVFGARGGEALNSMCRRTTATDRLLPPSGASLPATAQEVRQQLKSSFQQRKRKGDDDVAVFELLKYSHQEGIDTCSIISSSKNPSDGSSPLPVLQDQEAAASLLPGEKISFTLSNPRDQKLIEEALRLPSMSFLCSSSGKASSIQVKILQDPILLESGDMIVSCRAGQRVYQEPLVTSTATNDAAHTMSSCQWVAQRQSLLDNLGCVLHTQGSCLEEMIQYFGLPPLDSEPFSLWALRFFLPKTDIERRRKWVHTSPALRLNFIHAEMTEIVNHYQISAKMATISEDSEQQHQAHG